jgi:hypothetical protein
MPENGFHVGGGWWFVREPGGSVRIVKEPFPPTPGKDNDWLMDAATWRSVVHWVSGGEAGTITVNLDDLSAVLGAVGIQEADPEALDACVRLRLECR